MRARLRIEPALERAFLRALARAFAGAIIFALPLLMTMEMWALGFYMDPLRLALLLAVMFPLLVVLAYYAGFEESLQWQQLVLSAGVAYAVAFVAAAAGLALLGVLRPGMSLAEIVGKISLQAVPASIGAMLARSQLGERDEQKEEERRRDTYLGELFLSGVGALFLAFNVAPTEEVVLIATMMAGWQALALVGVSLAIMHAFVYAVEFRGRTVVHPEISFWSEFLRVTVVAYALALLICLYVLWSFGRTDGLALGELLMQTVVLGVPAAIGAAAARLIL
ncbi:MAG: TIGR02587 family membrane protein [Geminicoccaceae bacterium]